MTNNQHTSATWTDERLAELKHLWMTTDLSAKAIALQMHLVSRNAVLGKIHRMGLSMENRPEHAKETLRRALSGGGRKSLGRPNGGRPLKAPFVLPIKTAKPECLPPPISESLVSQNESRLPHQPPGQKPLLDLRNGECRWPSGEGTIAEPFLFCAAQQVDGSSYCCRHANEASRKGHLEFSDVNRQRMRGQGLRNMNLGTIQGKYVVGEAPTIEEMGK